MIMEQKTVVYISHKNNLSHFSNINEEYRWGLHSVVVALLHQVNADTDRRCLKVSLMSLVGVRVVMDYICKILSKM